jgi:hypothetical protein
MRHFHNMDHALGIQRAGCAGRPAARPSFVKIAGRISPVMTREVLRIGAALDRRAQYDTITGGK